MADFCVWGEFGTGRGMVVRQSLRLDGRKVCNIKRVGISRAESNKATVYALPSIHLPLTREASVVVRGEGIVRSGGHGGVMWSLLKHYALLPDTILTSAEN